jgi:nucleoside-diphosphate-sugar epimerase
LDITDTDTIARGLLEVRPAAVINAAVASGIELAEADPSNAQAINAVGPAKLAELCARAGIPLIHISTDYVFGAETNRGLGGKRIPCLRSMPTGGPRLTANDAYWPPTPELAWCGSHGYSAMAKILLLGCFPPGRLEPSPLPKTRLARRHQSTWPRSGCSI